MRILAIDPATTTGWAHSTGPSGVWNLKTGSNESIGMKFVRFIKNIQGIKETLGIDIIVYEISSVGSGLKANFMSAKLIDQLGAMIELYTETTPNVECKGYNLQTVKAHALPGEAKRDKKAMLSAAKNKWPGVKFQDDNEADAYWLLSLAEKTLFQ
jgi:hypothetical protein